MRHFRAGLIFVFMALMLTACNLNNAITPTPPPTLTPSQTLTLTKTSTATRTPTVTNTATQTLTSTVTQTPSITPSPTLTATETASPTPTLTATQTASNTPTLTPTSTLTLTPTITPSPTVTNTPTITPTLTLTNTATTTPFPDNTALPAILTPQPVLEGTPAVVPHDVISVAEDFGVRITSSYTLDQIGDEATAANETYLIFEADLLNYNEDDQNFFRTDFELILENGERVLPNLDAMFELQQERYFNRDYPRRSAIRINSLNVDANEWLPIFLVYRVPASTSAPTLRFRPAGIRPATTMQLWLLPDAESETFRIHKATDNANALYQITFAPTDRAESVAEEIDRERVTIDNCFGTEERFSTRSLEGSSLAAIEIGAIIVTNPQTSDDLVNQRDLAEPVLNNTFVRELISEAISQNHDVVDGARLTIPIDERVGAAPETQAEYELSWSQVTTQGVLHLEVGGYNYYVPYTVTDRLRSDLVSLPAEECPDASEFITETPASDGN